MAHGFTKAGGCQTAEILLYLYTYVCIHIYTHTYIYTCVGVYFFRDLDFIDQKLSTMESASHQQAVISNEVY